MPRIWRIAWAASADLRRAWGCSALDLRLPPARSHGQVSYRPISYLLHGPHKLRIP